MVATGNDFIVVDTRKGQDSKLKAQSLKLKTENSKLAVCPEWVLSDDIDNSVNPDGINITIESSI